MGAEAVGPGNPGEKTVRGAKSLVGTCFVIVASMLGCQTTQSELKPNLPAEFVLPPENDARFSSSPTFPKETLNTGPAKRFNTPMQQQAGAGMRGAGGRMGGGMGSGF